MTDCAVRFDIGVADIKVDCVLCAVVIIYDTALQEK